MVALDIGGTGIRAIQFTRGKNSSRVKKDGFISLPDGAVVNGEVRDGDAVTEALKALWKDRKFSTKRVLFAVANNNVIVRIKTLDWDFDDDFRSGLRYQESVVDELPFDDDKVLLDYHQLDEVTETLPNGDLRKQKVILLVAAESRMVDGFVSAIRGAGLSPEGIDSASFAMIRAARSQQADSVPAETVMDPEVDEALNTYLSDVTPTDDELVEVVIDLGVDVTNVIIHQGGQPRFVRIVTGQGGRRLTRALMTRFGWDENEAETVKREVGLTSDLVTGVANPAQETIAHVMSEFIAEIRTAIDYYLTYSPNVQGVSRVVLSGAGTRMKGLAERVSSELRVPVESVSLTGMFDDSQPDYTVAYGLTIGA